MAVSPSNLRNPRDPFPLDESAYMVDTDQVYQEMLNEAIIQSLLDQDKIDNQVEEDGANLVLPNQEAEEKMLKEVMKISALEYQKENGQLDLSHLKRKPSKKDEIDEALRKSGGNLTNDQLAKLAKIVAPKSLAPVVEGGRGKALGVGSGPGHINSTNTMGIQSYKTNDNTTV